MLPDTGHHEGTRRGRAGGICLHLEAFMTFKSRSTACWLGAILLSLPALAVAQQAEDAEREEAYRRLLTLSSLVQGGSIEPHWMQDGDRFWYADGAPRSTVIWVVDPEANTKEALFDTARVRGTLAGVLGVALPSAGLPFDSFSFVDETQRAVRFEVANRAFEMDLETYALEEVTGAGARRTDPQGPRPGEIPSPDGRWFAGVHDYNLWLRSAADGRTVALTEDGVANQAWDPRARRRSFTFVPQLRWAWWSPWSPDGRWLAAKKVDYTGLPRFPVVDWLGGDYDIEWIRHAWPDGRTWHDELYLLDVDSGRQVHVQTPEAHDRVIVILGWRPDGSELLFFHIDARWQRLDLMAADPESGSVRTILTETQNTFLYVPSWRSPLITLLPSGDRFVWRSERDGWSHLYLYRIDGTLLLRLTEGPFPVERVVAIDERNGWVYFIAHTDPDRPYDAHLCRVGLDGGAFKQLTAAPGRHEVRLSPSQRFFLDTHTNVDLLPATELRRTDGELLRTLAEADPRPVEALGWTPPEEFQVTSADGETELWGVLHRPYSFDPDKKYPVIDLMLGRPDVGVNELQRSHSRAAEAWARLGYVVVQVDARGTPDRGKAFHDVVYGNLGRHEIPDHVAALRQLAAQRPYMDLDRVGTYASGYSSYFAIRAMLLAPETYKVGVSLNGMVNAEGSSYWFRWYLGLPGDNKAGYEYASNVRLADRLQGRLLFIQSLSNRDRPLSHPLRLIDALVRAGKPYDLLLIPGDGLRIRPNARYARQALRRYFAEHLRP